MVRLSQLTPEDEGATAADLGSSSNALFPQHELTVSPGQGGWRSSVVNSRKRRDHRDPEAQEGVKYEDSDG